jgi:hypothetical protein
MCMARYVGLGCVALCRSSVQPQHRIPDYHSEIHAQDAAGTARDRGNLQ